jgi:cyanophycinase-like exopeptidase
MGSGETAPTMVKVHRQLLERLGPPPVPAVLLDTPFGFQENAKEIAGRAVTYFRESLRAPIAITGLEAGPTQEAGRDAFAEERLVSAIRNSRYVFAGPGSPSYALRKWQGTAVPSLLVEKLLHGGCVLFASAAALTLGVATVPVYEIYKCGEDPHWLEGLDITAAAGLRAAIIPHYDNNEGGTHDTRFCYLGERRLSRMERDLPDGAFVLGIDEHTACTFDLDAGTASVEGRGVVTVRAAGRSMTFPSGETVPIARILETAEALAHGATRQESSGQTTEAAPEPDGAEWPKIGRLPSTSPLVDLVREREAAFATAVASRDMALASSTVLDLERDVTEWSTDIPAGDELDRAHASLRSLILELGRLSEAGARDPRQVVGPLVEALLELRDGARRNRRFADADLVRDRLAEAGIEVRDTPDGSEWLLAGEGSAGPEAGP